MAPVVRFEHVAMDAGQLVERARDAVAAQRWDDARAAYEELLRGSPEDVSNAYALADVYRRLDRAKDAVALLQWVAGRFAAKGELLRAMAALQGILKIDPKHAETQRLLAELFAKRKAQAAATAAATGAVDEAPRRPTEPPRGAAATSAGLSSVAPTGGMPAARATPASQAAPAPEPEPLALPDDHILPLIPGEPVRRLKGPGEAPVGFPNAIPVRYANVPLFSSFATRTFIKVLGAVRVHRLAPETLILKEGEPGTAIFAVAEGQVRVTKEVGGQVLELATLPAGSFFGEMALLTGAPRRASIWSIGDAEILEIPKAALDEVVSEAPSMAETLRRFCRERLLQTALATGVLFRGLDPAARDKLVHRFRTEEARAGTRLLEEGKPADGIYVVVDGVLQVSKRDAAGKHRALALLRGGDFFGEMSFLYGGNAQATVSVSENATLLKLARGVAEETLRERPDLLATVKRVAEERIRANQLAVSASPGKPAEGATLA